MDQGSIISERSYGVIILWTLADRRGWPLRPDGYSLHTSNQAAKDYLNSIYESLSLDQESYCYPGTDWHDPVFFVPVLIPSTGPVAERMQGIDSLRVYDGDELVEEIKRLPRNGVIKNDQYHKGAQEIVSIIGSVDKKIRRNYEIYVGAMARCQEAMESRLIPKSDERSLKNYSSGNNLSFSPV